MRIQHNIPAMNAYRNYNNNTSKLSKNLEKLSSGYKINRAGDDAAGLAISEKMRAQITGLSAAQKNVKDGVSLVKTAEGAMQEIHDMLNRMDYLATQSANGTYDNEVDRLNLQKEVDALKSEINRIADSANFNGIKLLDGSLTKGGSAALALGSANAIESSLVDGIAPSPAGAAEITVTFGEAAQSKAVNPTRNTALDVDGQKPTDATSTVIKLTLPAAGGTDVSVGGTDCNEDTQIDALGAIVVNGTTKISDLFNICTDATGATVSNAGANGATDWTGTTGVGDTVFLVAKNPGQMSDTIANALKGWAGTGVEVTLGKNVGAGSDAVQPEYDVKVDLTKLAGGQTIEINGKKLYISEKADETTVPAGVTADAVFNISGFDRTNTGNPGANDDTDKWTGNGGDGTEAGGHGELAVALKGALSTLLNGKYTVGDVDLADYTQATGEYTFKLTGTAGADSVMQEKTFTVDGDAANQPLVTIDETKAYVASSAAVPGKHASVTYDGFDVGALTAGSKVVFGGTANADGTTAGGTAYTIVADQKDQDLTNAKGQGIKVWLGDCATDAAKAAKLEATYKANNTANASRMSIDAANKRITFTNAGDVNTPVTAANFDNTLKAGANAVSVYINGSSKFTASSANGLQVETGKTTVEQLKNTLLSNGKKVSDMFDIDVTADDGTTKKNGNTDVIGSGYKVVFTAKNVGKLDSTTMADLNFASTANAANKVSQIVKEGYDEGTGGAMQKTHYDLTFDLSAGKLTGGQSFTFGTDSGKSFTFDLSFDTTDTDNGTTVNNGTNNEVGATRHTINLGGIDPTDTKAMFDEIKKQVTAKMGTDFDVTGENTSGSSYTLKLDAKTATEATNLGGVRFSSESGGISGGNYTPAIISTGGDMGVYAQASWDFDLSRLSEGDTITIDGKTVSVGKESKTEVNADGSASVTLSVKDAQNAAKLAAAFETVGFDKGRLSFADKKLTITDTVADGKTGKTFAESISISMTAGASRTPKGLMLQIGDTSDEFNQMEVSVGDMHTTAMGTEGGDKISDIDISTQEGASKAVDVIKNAINYVSSVRGDLGAIQNRLEHTQNNLSVMAENIQDAESTIRDTDVADEMMNYVKNNILVQSAQAMLAQANQLPQGVLQLLG